MNEFELIARLTKSLATNETVLTGAGDDCAVLDLGVPDKLILFKTDATIVDPQGCSGCADIRRRGMAMRT